MGNDAEVQDESADLWVTSGAPPVMRAAHRHDDLELNLVTQAPLRYLFGGTPTEIGPGEIGMFWAAMPHRLLDGAENWRARVGWVHVPLVTVLGWGVPEQSLSRLLRGRPVLAPAQTAGALAPSDFDRWAEDLASGSGERRYVALLEIQALVRRLLLAVEDMAADTATGWPAEEDGSQHHVALMAQHVATHFREPLSTADVAGAAHLHPNYAMTLFRRVVGTTLGAYLAQCRVAEAQRLLLVTSATTSAIAGDSGFGSQSSFYATFTRVCGQTPGDYRRAAMSARDKLTVQSDAT